MLKRFIIVAILAIGLTAIVSAVKAAPTNTEKTVATATLEATQPTVNASASTKTIIQLDVPADRAVLLFGEVGDCADTVKAIYSLSKKDPTTPIYLIIDSPGGSVLGGAKVISAIEGVTAPVYTVDVGLAASMGAMIHAHGVKRFMTDRSVLMYHDYAGGVQGYGAHMTSLLTMINRYTQRMNAYIAQRAGVDLKEFQIGELKQIWLDAEDATQQHFNDGIVSLDVASLLPKDGIAYGKAIRLRAEAEAKYFDAISDMPPSGNVQKVDLQYNNLENVQ